jgi:hypothetical protein
MLNNGEGGKELGELATLLSVEEDADVFIIDGELRMGVCDPSVRELLAAGRFCLERNAFDALPRFFCSRLYSQSKPNTTQCSQGLWPSHLVRSWLHRSQALETRCLVAVLFRLVILELVP